MSKNIIISIDGNIGSGKSTLYENLKDFYKNDAKICFVPEPVEEWHNIVDDNGSPILSNFYKDQKKYAFRFQMMAYISRLNLIRKKVIEKKYDYIISERSVLTDKNVFAQMLYDDGFIEKDEFSIYLKWFDEFLDDVGVSGMVYVSAEPEICHSRVVKRGREGENIPIEYLKKCHDYHEKWIDGLESNISIMRIMANVDTTIDKNIRIQWIEDIDNWMKTIA